MKKSLHFAAPCLLAVALTACQEKSAVSSVALTPTATPASTPATAEAKPDASPSEAGMVTTASGLKYKDLKVGTGARPLMGQIVTVNYLGKLENGTIFDASERHGGPYKYPIGVGTVIPGWEIGIGGGQGVQPMRVGGKRLLIVPPKLGYGDHPMGIIPMNATLIFEIELLDAKAPKSF